VYFLLLEYSKVLYNETRYSYNFFPET